MANAAFGAKISQKLPDFGTFYKTPTLDLLPDMVRIPKCPNGGVYTIEPGTAGAPSSFRFRCSVHGTFEPGVDQK